MKQAVFLILPILAGVGLALQPLLNTRVATPLGSPLWAAAISFVVGTLGLFLAILAARAAVPELGRFSDVPPVAWSAGLLGAFFVIVTILAVPQIGTASLIALVIAGQIIAAIALDHFGIMQVPKPASIERLLGGVILIIGAVLVVRQ
ncbi:MAG: DMT family transporter [Pseudomonadota bacterium]